MHVLSASNDTNISGGNYQYAVTERYEYVLQNQEIPAGIPPFWAIDPTLHPCWRRKQNCIISSASNRWLIQNMWTGHPSSIVDLHPASLLGNRVEVSIWSIQNPSNYNSSSSIVGKYTICRYRNINITAAAEHSKFPTGKPLRNGSNILVDAKNDPKLLLPLRRRSKQAKYDRPALSHRWSTSI